MTHGDSSTITTADSESSHERNDQLLLEYLQANDAPCPICGYNVRRLTRPVCPECRHRLRLTVGVSDVSLKWFLAAIVPGVFSGIAATFLAIPIIVSPLAGNGSAPGFIIATDVFGFASGAAALLMMANRRRLIAKPPRAQMWIAIVAWLIHILAFLTLLGHAIGWY